MKRSPLLLLILAAAGVTQAVAADFRDARLQFDGSNDIVAIASRPGLSPGGASSPSRVSAIAGQRILDEGFIDFARRPVRSLMGLPVIDTTNYPNASNRYGVLWWSNADGQLTDVPRDAYWAWGLGEELIVVIPSLDIVVARLGSQGSPSSGGKPSVLAPFLGPVSRSVN